MANFLTIVQVIVGLLLVAAVLLQQKGAGLGSAFGGGAEVYSVKRGAEKTIFVATIVLSFIFIGLGVARLLI